MVKFHRTWLLAAMVPFGAFAQSGTPVTKPAIPVEAAAGGATPEPQALFIVQLTTGPAWDQSKEADEQPGFKEHSQNLARLRRAGMLLVGARFRDGIGDKGMLILRVADQKAAMEQFATDPMVRDKRFNVDVAEFQPFFEGYVARPLRTADAPAAALKSLAWLPGCWTGRNSRTEFREHWMPAAGGMMMGMARTLADRKVVSFEATRIEIDASGVPVFIAKPSGQPEGSFRMAASTANRVVFENLAHDFPQRIIYELKAESVLHARIEGTQNGKPRSVDFPMHRASCD
jgi:hypothetical protein